MVKLYRYLLLVSSTARAALVNVMCFNDDFLNNLDSYQQLPEIKPSGTVEQATFADTDITDEELLSDDFNIAILSAELTRKEFIGE